VSVSLRTFFAVELDAGARAYAAALSKRLEAAPGGDAIRWVPSENLHVTLRFLGPTPSEKVPNLVASVGRETAEQASFAARLGELSALPSARRPRVLTLTVDSDGRLEALSSAVERGVVRMGFEPEQRPFRAHLTLGRRRNGRTIRAAEAVRRRARPWLVREPASGITFRVDNVVLFQSLSRDGGVEYAPLERIALRPGLTRNPSSTEVPPEEKM